MGGVLLFQARTGHKVSRRRTRSAAVPCLPAAVLPRDGCDVSCSLYPRSSWQLFFLAPIPLPSQFAFCAPSRAAGGAGPGPEAWRKEGERPSSRLPPRRPEPGAGPPPPGLREAWRGGWRQCRAGPRGGAQGARWPLLSEPGPAAPPRAAQ